MNNIQQFESVEPKIWEAGKMILGPKHKPVERMAIYQPTTQDLLTDPKDILAARFYPPCKRGNFRNSSSDIRKTI